MGDLIEDVAKFHRAMNVPLPIEPGWPSDERVELRMNLIHEEVREELETAVRSRDLVETADAIVDGIYVLIGMGLELGLPMQGIWDEVQRSNMAKAGGPRRSDGKILKPEGWVPPDVAGVMTKAEGRALDEQIASDLVGDLCGDCPPEGYGNLTRCLPCPRRQTEERDDG